MDQAELHRIREKMKRVVPGVAFYLYVGLKNREAINRACEEYLKQGQTLFKITKKVKYRSNIPWTGKG